MRYGAAGAASSKQLVRCQKRVKVVKRKRAAARGPAHILSEVDIPSGSDQLLGAGNFNTPLTNRMQYNFTIIPTAATTCQATISPARLSKYLIEAKGNLPLALRLYFWNNSLCAAFYGPLQLAEVAIRNAVIKPVLTRFGQSWHQSQKFHGILNKFQSKQLKDAFDKEQKQHGHQTTSEHVTSALPFGFWVGLMSKSFDNQLWPNGIHSSFPNAPKHFSRYDIHKEIDSIRSFRNDIMHYRSVFDKNPRAKIRQIVEITDYICVDLSFAISTANNVESVISNKPSQNN